jgi:hypothetical protein
MNFEEYWDDLSVDRRDIEIAKEVMGYGIIQSRAEGISLKHYIGDPRHDLAVPAYTSDDKMADQVKTKLDEKYQVKVMTMSPREWMVELYDRSTDDLAVDTDGYRSSRAEAICYAALKAALINKNK